VQEPKLIHNVYYKFCNRKFANKVGKHILNALKSFENEPCKNGTKTIYSAP